MTDERLEHIVNITTASMGGMGFERELLTALLDERIRVERLTLALKHAALSLANHGIHNPAEKAFAALGEEEAR